MKTLKLKSQASVMEKTAVIAFLFFHLQLVDSSCNSFLPQLSAGWVVDLMLEWKEEMCTLSLEGPESLVCPCDYVGICYIVVNIEL